MVISPWLKESGCNAKNPWETHLNQKAMKSTSALAWDKYHLPEYKEIVLETQDPVG